MDTAFETTALPTSASVGRDGRSREEITSGWCFGNKFPWTTKNATIKHTAVANNLSLKQKMGEVILYLILLRGSTFETDVGPEIGFLFTLIIIVSNIQTKA